MKQTFAASIPDKGGSPSFSPDQYTISIRKEEVEGEVFFVGRVAEFPDVTTYEESPPASYSAVISVIDGLVTQLREIGKDVPAPQVVPEEFSGRVTFRMPRSLHARVDARAQLEGVSINTWLVAAAENYLGTTGQVAKHSMHNALFVGDSISGVAMVTSLTSANEMAVTVMKQAITAANTTYGHIPKVIMGKMSSMGDLDEPDDGSHPVHHQH